jgi:hypothetical protein
MNISGKFQKITLFLYHDGLISPLKEVPDPPVTTVKIPRVDTVEMPQGQG